MKEEREVRTIKYNPIYEEYLMGTGKRYNVLFGGRGCLAPNTNVVMYDGALKKVQDVVIGDKLMGADSTPRTVQRLFFGYDEMYDIVQNKGMTYTVNKDHVLSLKLSTRSAIRKGRNTVRGLEYGGIKNLTVSEYIAESNKFKRFFIGYRTGVDFPEKTVTIDPYFLGLWLGDGTRRTTGVTTMDDEIRDYIYAYANKIEHGVTVQRKPNTKAASYTITRGNTRDSDNDILFKKFKARNLIGNKHIPKEYLYNTRDIRLRVLAGILDADGSLHRNCFDIIQKDERLAKEIRYLAHSLGLRCSMKKCTKTIKSIGFSGEYYRLNISGNTQIIPCLLPRKKIKYYSKLVGADTTGFNIVPKGWGEYYGFMLDGDGLFLLEDFTVTHNSGKSVASAQRQVLRLINETGANHVILGVRKIQASIRDSIFREVNNVIKDWGLTRLFKINETRCSFTYVPNGNELITTGIDDPEKQKSKPITSGWIEEATELEFYDFAELDLGLRGHRKFPMEWTLTFNPISEDHWLKSHFFDKKSDKTYILHSTFNDNIFIGDEARKAYIDQYQHDENLARVCLRGEWGRVRTGSEYFPAFDRAKHTDFVLFDPDLPLHISFDFNRSPYITLLVFQVERDGLMYDVRQIDEICLEPPDNMTENVCDAFVQKYGDILNSPVFLYGDASGRQRDTRQNQNDYDIIQYILRRYIATDGMRVPSKNPPVKKKREFMNKLLAGGYPVKIRINKNCKNTIMDYENLLQDPLTGGMYKHHARHPITKIVYEKYGHCADASTYFFCEAFRGFFEEFEPKYLF